MTLRAVMWALPFLAMGCVVPAAEPEAHEAQGGEPPPVRCAYDVQAPHAASGALTGYFGPGVDCVPPEGGDVFSFGFAIAGEVIKVTAPRPVSDTYALYGTLDGTACVDWSGTVHIVDERDWSITVDATCTTSTPPQHLQATFYGSR